ncbi:shikimate kinase [Rothia mucilaginosa]|uniref:Shikimate kinase n=1 Tax=Rothia mucilaginosa TaxID=43675 RepID=A0A943TBS1_9MICC|nr:shikimate kinase [Rothia mucilaginosa]MBS6634997.1 shikimate kinase [Rothia mucilaginosa]
MPLPAESEGRGFGEVSVEQGVRPVASSPLARIAAAAQRARGGASPRPEAGVPEAGVSAAAEQAVEATSAEDTAREASSRRASRVPTPADLMRSGVRPRPAAPVSVRGVRLYASSASEDADPAAGLDEDLRLKLLSALQGMAEEEPREEPAQAEVPKSAAPKPVAPKPTAPKLAPPKPTAPKPAAPKPLRPTPALFGKVQVSATESVAEEIAAVDSAEAAAEVEARAASEAEMDAELGAREATQCEAIRVEVSDLESGELAQAEFETVELEVIEFEESARIHPQQVREMHENFAEQSRPIVLIGPMAAGKTYIGTHLARFYGYEFLDADQLIVERHGEVSEIFEIFGEAHFRELERKTIEEVLTSPVYRNTVFSLGGGAPMTDSVAELLKDECVVYILVDAETVTPRITGNKTRPLLQPNPVERWTDIFERRRTRYEELAHFTLDARGGRPITEMTAEIQAYVTASRKARANNS